MHTYFPGGLCLELFSVQLNNSSDFFQCIGAIVAFYDKPTNVIRHVKCIYV